MIPSQNRIEISVKGATSVLVGVKGLKEQIARTMSELFMITYYEFHDYESYKRLCEKKTQATIERLWTDYENCDYDSY